MTASPNDELLVDEAGLGRMKASLRGTAIVLLVVFALVTVAASTMAERFKFIYDIPGADKTGHFVLMGALSFAFVAGFSGARVGGRVLSALACVALLLVLVVVEESTQVFFPARRFSLQDLGASVAGILVFAWPGAMLSRRDDPAGDETP